MKIKKGIIAKIIASSLLCATICGNSIQPLAMKTNQSDVTFIENIPEPEFKLTNIDKLSIPYIYNGMGTKFIENPNKETDPYIINFHDGHDKLKINSIKSITPEKVKECFGLTKDLLSPEEIIAFFQNEEYIEYIEDYKIVSGNNCTKLEYKKVSNDKMNKIQLAMKDLLNPILAQIPTKNTKFSVCHKFLDIFVKRFKNHIFNSKTKIKICISNKKESAPHALFGAQMINIPLNIEDGKLNCDFSYITPVAFSPLALNQLDLQEMYKYQPLDNSEKSLMGGIIFCHELNHLLFYNMQCLPNPNNYIINDDDNLKQALCLTSPYAIQQTTSVPKQKDFLWSNAIEISTITGALPITQNGKTTLYVNSLFNELIAFADYAMPIRWGHQSDLPSISHVIKTASDNKIFIKFGYTRFYKSLKEYINNEMSNFYKQYFGNNESTRQTYEKHTKMLIESIAHARHLDANLQPSDDQLKFIFTINQISKKAYEKNLRNVAMKKNEQMLKIEESSIKANWCEIQPFIVK